MTLHAYPKHAAFAKTVAVLALLLVAPIASNAQESPPPIGDMSIRNAEVFEFAQFAEAAVCALAFTPDSQAVVCGLDDGRVLMLSVEDGSLIRELLAHTHSVTSVAVSPGGQWIASSSRDGSVHVTDLTDGGETRALQHSAAVHDVEFSPLGTYLASAGQARCVRLWEVATWRERDPIRGHTGTIYALGISPAEDLIVTGSGDANDRSIRLWDLQSGEELASDFYEYRVHDIEYSPRARDRYATISSTSNLMILWDVDTAAYRHLIAPFGGAVNDAAYSILGNTLVAVCDDGRFFFTTMPHWTKKRTIDFDNPLLAVAFSDSRQYIACSDDAGALFLVYIPADG